jgi:putative transposase
MKTRQFTDEQIVALLQATQKGDPSIAALSKPHGIPETTFYRWRRPFGRLPVPEVAPLREREREPARLKRLLAERDLERDVLKEALRINW